MVILYTTRKAKNKEMITDNIIILPKKPCMPFNIPEARSLLLIAADKEFNFIYDERWFSPIDRTLRRELKSKFGSGLFWFNTVNYKELVDLRIKYENG